MGFTLDSTQVEGNVFKPSGKWEYTVQLDYSWASKADWEHWDLWENAKRALREATAKHTSGVTFYELSEGWFMVVLEPYGKNSHPIIVKSNDNMTMGLH